MIDTKNLTKDKVKHAGWKKALHKAYKVEAPWKSLEVLVLLNGLDD